MELLLWRWSTIVQISSGVIIALFFLSLASATRRVELKPWVFAWLANLFALVVTVIYWFFQPQSAWVFGITSAGYIFFKSLFVLCLLIGLRRYLEGSHFLSLRYRQAFYWAGGTGLLGAALVPNIPWLGVLQCVVIALGLYTATWLAIKCRSNVLTWLTVGFATRATLAVIEGVSYSFSALNPESSNQTVNYILAAHSSFDSAAEWLIALGCVLALYRTIQNELSATCDNLVKVKDELQELVDLDPLTGLSNRRSLRAILERASSDQGATILFFDLDNFKQINDRYGHKVGDECLQRFADALRFQFRPDDHLVRYAGDEFVVVADKVSPEELAPRVELTRQQVAARQGNNPGIQFSVGIAYLAPGGEPEKAIHQADREMYLQKGS